MKSFYLLFILCIACVNAQAQPLPAAWQKIYRYEYVGGYDGGGTPDTGAAIIIDYTLYLNPPSSTCRLTVQGFQTDDDIVCMAVQGKNTLDIQFKHFANGNTANTYGLHPYSVGGSLFTLSRKKNVIVTQWNQLSPDGKKTAGVYFQSSNNVGKPKP